jgi:hypothetical protein
VRGSPLLRALFAFLAILSLGYPLRRLTSESEAPAVAPQAPQAETTREIALQLTFSGQPKSFRVLHLGQVVWNEAAPAVEMERKVRIAFPKEGIDLQFQAEFAEGGSPAALRVKFTDPDGDELEKTLWGAGTIDDVLTFP